VNRDKFEQQQVFYEAFFGHRIGPSQVKGLERQFSSMINDLQDDLRFFHKDATPEKIREAIILALRVMYRLGAKHPNCYVKESSIGMRAFKHADRFLLGNPLPLPQVSNVEDAWDIEQERRAEEQAKLKQEREEQRELSRPPDIDTSQSVANFLQHWRETGEFPSEFPLDEN